MTAFDLFQIILTAMNYVVAVAILAVGFGGVFVFLYQLSLDKRRRGMSIGSDYSAILDE